MVRYTTNKGGNIFVCPTRLPLYDSTIADDAKTVVRVCAELAHKAYLDDYTSYKADKRGAAKFLQDAMEEVWYNKLKDTDTFYAKLTALDIIAFLNANSRGLQAVDMISLQTNMHAYYVQADGIPSISTCQKMPRRRQSGWACPLPTLSL